MSAKSPHYQRSARGMAAALLVTVVIVLGFWALKGAGTPTSSDGPVEPVKYAKAAKFARQHASIPVWAPAHLPRGWRATSVRFEDGKRPAWHLGVLTDQDHYIGLEQRRRPAETMVDTHVDPEATRVGTIEVGTPAGPQTWRVWTDSGGDLALTLRLHGATTLLVGTVPQPVLVDYAESLR